jgi:hypothetical protein
MNKISNYSFFVKLYHFSKIIIKGITSVRKMEPEIRRNKKP